MNFATALADFIVGMIAGPLVGMILGPLLVYVGYMVFRL